MFRSVRATRLAVALVAAGAALGATWANPAVAQDLQAARAQVSAINRAVDNQVHHAMRPKPAAPLTPMVKPASISSAADVAGAGIDEAATAARASSSASLLRAGGVADR